MSILLNKVINSNNNINNKISYNLDTDLEDENGGYKTDDVHLKPKVNVRTSYKDVPEAVNNIIVNNTNNNKPLNSSMVSFELDGKTQLS